MSTSPQEPAPDETTDPQETDPPRPDLPDDRTAEPADKPDNGESGADPEG